MVFDISSSSCYRLYEHFETRRHGKFINFTPATDSNSSFLTSLKVLGNHEFDDGLDGLIPFLNGAKFPILAANIINSVEHRIWKTRSLKKSLVLKVRGTLVGIIGYLTPETKNITSNNDALEFASEIETIK